MKKSFSSRALVTATSVLLFISCSGNENPGDAARNSGESLPAKNIYEVKTEMPGEGFALLQTHCLTCHSLRYIEMQPAFPEKTWEKIVDKMVKNFGAPIPDSTAKEIVKYLVEVKGK